MKSPAIAVFRARFGSDIDQRTPSERGEKLIRGLRESLHRGEFIGPGANAVPSRPRAQLEVAHSGWHESSFELLHGTMISYRANVLEADGFASQDDAPGILGNAQQAGALDRLTG